MSSNEENLTELSTEALELIKGMILSLDRTLRSQRLYAANNPVLQRHRQDLTHSFQKYLEQFGAITFKVGTYEFLVSGTQVYHNEIQQESFAFKLFNDGIRSLTFKPGLSDEELLGFATSFGADMDREIDDSDSVTRFWEKDFEHIHIAVADLIVDASSDEDEKSTDEKLEEILDPKMGMYQGPATEPDDEAYEALASENLNVTLNMVSVGQMFHNKNVLTGDELKQIQADIYECDQPERLVLDFVDMVLAVLQEETNKEEFIKTLDSLGTVLDHNFLHGELHIAAMVMEQVHNFPVRPIKMTRVDPLLMPNTLKALWTPARIELLFQALNLDTKATPQQIQTLVELMDPTSLPTLLTLLPTLQKPPIRQVVSKALANLHKGDIGIFTRMLSSKDPAIIKVGMELVSFLKNDKVVDLLSPFILKRDQFQKEAIDLLRNYKSPKAYGLLINLLEDPSEEIRSLALRSLSSSTDKEVARHLMVTLNRGDFNQRSFREKKTYFETVAKIAKDDFVPFLENILSTTLWFRKPEMDEQYKLATYGLAIVNSPMALKVLEESTKSKNKIVKQLSESALRLLGRTESTETESLK